MNIEFYFCRMSCFDKKDGRLFFSLDSIFFIFIFSAVILTANWACTKDLSTPGGKANLSISNFSSNRQPFKATIDATLITTDTLGANQTSGTQGNPYMEALPGVHQFGLTPDGTTFFGKGNLSLTANTHYSIFVFDSLTQTSVSNFILKDNLPIITDTFAAYRFLNLSPDDSDINLQLIKGTDTLYTLHTVYPGWLSSTSGLASFRTIPSGNYGINLFTDSLVILLHDTLVLEQGKYFTYVLSGFRNSAAVNTLHTNTIQHN